MIMDVNKAASNLINQIEAPRGAVNALEAIDGDGAYIRLLVDPLYWLSLPNLPRMFEGYRVVVERREITISLH